MLRIYRKLKICTSAASKEGCSLQDEVNKLLGGNYEIIKGLPAESAHELLQNCSYQSWKVTDMMPVGLSWQLPNVFRNWSQVGLLIGQQRSDCTDQDEVVLLQLPAQY